MSSSSSPASNERLAQHERLIARIQARCAELDKRLDELESKLPESLKAVAPELLQHGEPEGTTNLPPRRPRKPR